MSSMANPADIARLSLDDTSRRTEYEKGFADFAAIRSHDVESFSKREEQILALYDRLEELRLEVALSEGHGNQPAVDATISDDNISDRLKGAEREYLESRSAYLLKISIIESVLVTDPILKAVHSGANATPAERRLHPLIDRRDVLSIAHSNLESYLTTIRNDLTVVEAQNITSSRKNRTLTNTLLDLTASLQGQGAEDVSSPRLRSQIQFLKEETKTSKARWRIMKSVTAAVIVGSGVDWSRNNELRELVLDDEDGPT